jgi:serine/threonine-protein kinase
VPCLTDFGLARLIDDDASDRTRTGTMLGTPSYMAPEQADGRTEEIGPHTDVYALGQFSTSCWRGARHFVAPTILRRCAW